MCVCVCENIRNAHIRIYTYIQENRLVHTDRLK